MALPQIPLYSGDTPDRLNQTPSQFSNSADSWLNYQDTLPASYNNLAIALNALSIDVENNAESADASAKSASSTANYKGVWSSLSGALSIPASVYHKGANWQLLESVNDVTTEEPSVSTKWLEINDVFKSSLVTSRLKQKADLNESDIFVLCQGDSTGDEDDEFFRVIANRFVSIYPSHTIKYVMWNHALTQWDAPIDLSVGTGDKTIYFYNGSYSGATHGYWTGSRNQYAYDGNDFDVIISNYGLNVIGVWKSQAEQQAEYLFTLRQQQPEAHILVNIQPPDYNLLNRSMLRADAQRYVCDLYGCQSVDLYNLFIKLVDSTGGDRSVWYTDDIHPTAEGSQRWADLLLHNILYSPALGSSCNRPIYSSPNGIPNGNFSSWLNGNSDVPTFWKALSGQSVLRNTLDFETGDESVQVEGFGTGTGVLYVDGADHIIKRFAHYGDVVIAARVKSTGASGLSGLLFFAHSASTSYTEIQNTQAALGYANDAWRWAFLIVPKEFIEGNSDFRFGVFSGPSGERCLIDRIVIRPNLFISESNGESGFTFRVKNILDSSFSVAANSGETRIFSGLGIPVQAGCKVECVPENAPLGLQITALSQADGNIVVRISNYTSSAITMPATAYTFTSTINE